MGAASIGQRVAVNAAALAAGRVVLIVTGVVSVGLATRYLGVSTFGALATGTALLGVLGPLTDAGLVTVGAREMAKRPGEIDRLAGTIVAISLILSLVAVAIGLGAAFLVYGHNEDTQQAILLLMISVPAAAPVGAANAYFLSQQKSYLATLASVVGSLFTVALLVLAIWLDWGFAGIVLAYVANSLGYGACLVALSLGRVSLRPVIDPEIWRPLVRWALPVGSAFFVHTLYFRIDLLMLSPLGTAQDVGFYGLVFRIVDALYALPYVVAITLMPELARLADHRRRVDELMQKAFVVMALVAAPLLVLFLAFADQVVNAVAGPDFAGAAQILRIVMVAVFFSYLCAVFLQALIALNRQVRLLQLWLLVLAANVVLNLVLIPPFGAVGAASALVVTDALALAVAMALYRTLGSVPRPRGAGRLLLAAAAMAAVGFAASRLPWADPAVLALGGALSCAVYAAALYALRAMPEEVHAGLVMPVVNRLSRRR